MKTPEERQESKLVRELRKEVIRLRRQVKEMKRDMRYAEEDQDEENDSLIVQPVVNNKERCPCPSCGSYSVISFELIGKEYYRCLDCDAKGRKQT